MGFPVMWSAFQLQVLLPNQHLLPNSRFVTWFSSFQNCFTHVLLFFFSQNIPKRFNKPMHEKKLLHVCIGGIESLFICCKWIHNLFLEFLLSQTSVFVCRDMESLDGHAIKFSLKHIYLFYLFYLFHNSHSNAYIFFYLFQIFYVFSFFFF